MNEKSLEVLNQYDVKIMGCVRGRGGILVSTDKGEKLLLECSKQDKYYLREDCITRAVKENGFENVDTYVRNSDNEIISALPDEGRKYVLKDMYPGSECNVKNLRDIKASVSTMAKLHIALNAASSSLCINDSGVRLSRGSIKDTVIRHTRELKMAENYLKNKKRRTEYELTIYKQLGKFYSEARTAVDMLQNSEVEARLEKALDSNELIHGNFNYHNVIICDKPERGNYSAGSNTSGVMAAVTNMEKCRIDCQIWDLYQFMRKILEKYNWDIDLAFKMLDEYDKVKPVEDGELKVLSVLFTFPEKFWKITNYYYNMNKAWVPPKSIEKLESCIAQNGRRLDFLATIRTM
ncbi:MAG: hypothetical protein ACI4D0_03210 [Lachnospira sp.]